VLLGQDKNTLYLNGATWFKFCFHMSRSIASLGTSYLPFTTSLFPAASRHLQFCNANFLPIDSDHVDAATIFPKQATNKPQYTPLLCIFFQLIPKSHHFHIKMSTIKHSSSLSQLWNRAILRKTSLVQYSFKSNSLKFHLFSCFFTILHKDCHFLLMTCKTLKLQN
jgi:hypothetical protein